MKFAELLALAATDPLFDSGLLLAGEVDRTDIRRQLSRWVRAGKLVQLRRGLYALAAPYRRVEPHPFLIANRIDRGSYVSRQSVLAYRGLIPEYVPTVTSVTTGRPGTRETPFGRFDYRHVKRAWFTSYNREAVERGQEAFVATAEKALLDVVYLETDADTEAYLSELRLQNLEALDLSRLVALAKASGRPKLLRAADVVRRLAIVEAEAYEVV